MLNLHFSTGLDQTIASIFILFQNTNESRHEISKNMIVATSKGSDQPVCMYVQSDEFSYWPNIIGVSKLSWRLHRLV